MLILQQEFEKGTVRNVNANNLVHIGEADISVKEYNGQRVVTFKDIDVVHGRPEGTARKRFSDNRERFIEGKHFIKITASEFRTTIGNMDLRQQNDVNLVTERGYLMLVKSFTDDLAWEVQDQLVDNYFRVRQLVDDLSPQMKLLYGLCDQLAQAEREAKEAKKIADSAKEVASKAYEVTENIKDAVKPILDNWREEINTKFNRIQKSCGTEFNVLRNEMYSELERRAGCDLGTRLRNKKQRMSDSGCTKTEIKNTNRMDIIDEDKKLREIFSKIVSEYEIKYCA